MYKTFALVTGASKGLGKYLALECAKRKMNLVLVALPNSGLFRLSKYLEKTFEIEVVNFEFDLSDTASCYQLFNAVKEKGIYINTLINNAGHGGLFYFNEKRAEYYTKMISLNITAPTLLCRLFLSDLKKTSPSYILNVSSIAGLIPLPKKQVYGGTKAYLISFSKSLRQELKRENVSVSVLCPGGMNTTWQLMISNRIKGTWLSRRSVMEPMTVAAISIKAMLHNKELIIPGVWNHFFLFLDRVMPGILKEKFINILIAKTNSSNDAVIRELKQDKQLAAAK